MSLYNDIRPTGWLHECLSVSKLAVIFLDTVNVINGQTLLDGTSH